MKVENKVVVVTGGGSGIGRALTLRLVEAGARVAAVDINAEGLTETRALAGDGAAAISLHRVNVTDRSAVADLPERVIAAHGTVDGLINNAGIIQPFVRLNDLAFDVIEQVLDVNLYGPLYMTKAFLPHLLARPVAHVVNVSSMGGFLPVPGQTLYGASKAGVKLLTEGLYAELLDTHVRVTVVFPGATDTGIAQNSGVAIEGMDPDEAAQSYHPVAPEVAAEAIVDGMEKDKFQIYVGRDARMMNILYRLNPRWATHFIFRQMKPLLPDP